MASVNDSLREMLVYEGDTTYVYRFVTFEVPEVRRHYKGYFIGRPYKETKMTFLMRSIDSLNDTTWPDDETLERWARFRDSQITKVP